MLKNIDILTLFPDIFSNFLSTSIIGRAIKNNFVNVRIYNYRDFSKNKKVDDYPYGGGSGMLLKVQPIYDCLNFCLNQSYSSSFPKIIMLTPKGEKFNQQMANEFANTEHLIFLCGHYEGFDERIRTKLVTHEVSIGDFITTGGETPAMVILDSVIRLVKGVIKEESIIEESFNDGLLEYPQYTRPKDFNGWKVPEVLLSGDHSKIKNWRKKQQKLNTLKNRPDLCK